MSTISHDPDGGSTVPFSVVLTVPAYLDALRVYMSSEFCEETILFYIACTKYENQSTAGLLEQAKHIFHTYVSMTALFYVELSKTLIREIQFVIANQTPTPTLFESAKRAVAETIEKNVYPRFVNSSAYHAMVGQRDWVPHLSRDLTRKSQLLRRSLQIAISASHGNAFLDKFYETLCAVSPESNMLFQSNAMHRETALQSVLSSMLTFLDTTDKQFCDSTHRLAEMHLRIGVTQSMFEAFGNCMIKTFCDYLLLEHKSLESVSIEYHWRAAYNALANEMINSMVQLVGDANQGTAKSDITKWPMQELIDYKSYVSLTLMLISKRGKDEFNAKFFAKFLELSPASAVHFEGPDHQARALWGALNAVVKMLENPKKLRSTLATIAAVHKQRGISQKEAVLFVRALRMCFRAEIGLEYTERMDAAWKQFLEIFFYSLGATPEEILRRSERMSSLDFDRKFEEDDTYAAIVKNQPTEPTTRRKTATVRHEYSEARESRSQVSSHPEIAEQASFVDCSANSAYTEALHTYLGNEWEEERLLFYLAAKQYQINSASMVASERMELARRIQTLYVGQSALFSVDLPPNQVKDITQAIKSRAVSSSLYDVHTRFMSSGAGRALRGLSPHGALPKRSIKASAILARLLQIALGAAKSGGTFSTGLYKQLFVESPEAKMLFSSDPVHQDVALQGLLTTMATYLTGNAKEFGNLINKIASTHVKMRITKSMFEAFGGAIITTLGQHLFLDPSGIEWHVIDRHWRAAFALVTQEVLSATGTFAFKSKRLFSRDDTPKWLIQQFAEYQSYTALTVVLASRVGNDRLMEAFYAQFFELSPGSAVKFASPNHQSKAFFGALDAVSKLLKHPRKMRKTLETIQLVHKNKGICNRECMMFITALRNTFRSEIGVEYTDKMDTVWKQVLEFTVMYATTKDDDGSRESKHSERCRVSSNKPNDASEESLSSPCAEPHCMAEALASPLFLNHAVAFYAKEFTEENVLFYKKCTEFKSQYESKSSQEMVDAAKAIVALYIQSASLLNVNCPQPITRDILHAIANGVVTPSLFEAARANIAQQMEKDFEKFTRSSSWLRATSSTAQAPIDKDKPPRQAIRQSSILGSSLQIASTKGTFSEALYEVLFQISPEAKILFHDNPSHQGAALHGALSHLLSFVKQNDKQFSAAAKQLAGKHLLMGITKNMFKSFGVALISTLQEHICLEERSLEWQTIKRHWQTAYDLISGDILFEMRQLEPEANRFFNRSKGAPKWLLNQLVECKTFTSLTMQIITRKGNDVFQAAFFARFFQTSPESAPKFAHPDSQKVALWGALDSVMKLLKKPNSMRKTIAKIEALHAAKGISHKEYTHFVNALRGTFRAVLGEEYTERMDVVWKQYFELILCFLDKDGTPASGIDDMSFEALIEGKELSVSDRRKTSSTRISERFSQDSKRRSFMTPPDSSVTHRRHTGDENSSDDDDSTRPRPPPKSTFSDLLKNPAYLEAFRSFMSSEFQDEKMLFYLACTKFEQGAQVGMTERARHIYELYLDSSALFRIKVPQSEVDAIVTAMTNKETSLRLFQNLKACVTEDLEKTAYPRFLRTAEWRALCTGHQLDPSRKYLGSSDRNSRTAIQQSVLLRRTFELVTNVNGESFTDMFYQELFLLSPEAQLLFARGRPHQAAALKGALSSLLLFLESSEADFVAATRRLSAIHFQMGITRSMFASFGDALIHALQKYLAMDTASLEWEAIQAHWRAVYGLIAKQIVAGMTSAKAITFEDSGKPIPKWLEAQFVECQAYVALANSAIERCNKEKFAEAFFQQFFLQSPDSVKKFDGFNREHALFGALNSVTKLMDQPKDMKQILGKVAQTHQDKDIAQAEYVIFAQTLRQLLRTELGAGYTEKMDAMWKQYLEFLVLFLWDKEDIKLDKAPKYLRLKSADSQTSTTHDADLSQSSSSRRGSEASHYNRQRESSEPYADLRYYSKPEEVNLTEFLLVPSNADAFWEFMRSEFYEEHMLLYKACQRYRASSDRLGAAKDIFSLYLQPGSIFFCNLPQTHTANIQREIEMGAPGIDLFEPQKELVIQQLQKDSFPRFMATEMGRADLRHSPRTMQRTIRQSTIASRLFAIALADPGFTSTFFDALAQASPEAEALLSASGHPSNFKGGFANLLTLLRQSERQFSIHVKRLAKTHLRMGITRAMLEDFGTTIQQVVRSYMSFNMTPEESATLDRHWNGVFGLVVSEILQSMTQLGPETKGFFTKTDEAPKWMQQYFSQLNAHGTQTMLLVKKVGFDRFQSAFYTNFFELSPSSERKFGNSAQRGATLLAAMNAIVKLVKKPKSMRKNLCKVAGIHRDRDITYDECASFNSALRSTLQSELKEDFSPHMDLFWKQFSELFLLFFSQSVELAPVSTVRPTYDDDDRSVSDSSMSGRSMSAPPPPTPRLVNSLEDYLNSPPGPQKPGTFWDVMQDPAKLEMLRMFANDEFKEENILFYLACTQFQKCSQEDMERAATEIYGRYLSPNALFATSVDPGEASNVMQALAEQKINLNTFDRAKASALKAIDRDTYSRFIVTPMGRLLRGVRDTIGSRPPLNKQRAMQDSALIRRSFELISRPDPDAPLVDMLFQEFFRTAPEVELLFQPENLTHLGASFLGTLNNLILLSNFNQDRMTKEIKGLAEVHAAVGVTWGMFDSFGKALLVTAQKKLKLDPTSLEWDAVSRHWQAMYETLSNEMLQHMIQLGPTYILSKNDVNCPPYVKRFPEFEALATQTVALVNKTDNFSEKFFNRFFQASPQSAKKYEVAGSQSKCFLGALNGVVGMLENPRKFRQTLVQVAKVHRGKSIARPEFVQFIQCFSETLRHERGDAFTVEMDGVWKRCLGACELFLGDDSIVMNLGPPPPPQSPEAVADAERSEFRALLDDPVQFEAFQAFSQREFTEEHVLFYLACKKFQKNAQTQSGAEMLIAAQNIVSLYLGPTSLFFVGVPPKDLRQLFSAIQSKTASADMLKPLKYAAVSAMKKDLYSRYKSQKGAQNEREAIKQSLLLSRALQLIVSFNVTGSYSEAFFNQFFVEAPEAKSMFLHQPSNQSKSLQGVLKTFVQFLKQPTKQHMAIMKRIAALHLQMGITEGMFMAVGQTLLKTLNAQLLLDETSVEWAAIERHFGTVCRIVVGDMLAAMGELPEVIYKEREIPKWVLTQAAAHAANVRISVQLVDKRGEAFMEAFYSKFFELSPASARRFTGVAHQSKALWGAVKTITKLLEKPTKMRRTLGKVAKLHRGKGILHKEFVMFAKALRMAFQSELGTSFTEQMDCVWKQFLDLCVQFFADKPTVETQELKLEEEDDFSSESNSNSEVSVSRTSQPRSSSSASAPVEMKIRGAEMLMSHDDDPRNKLTPREAEFLKQICPDGRLTSPNSLSGFFHFVQKCPPTKRLDVLNQYFMTSWCQPGILEEMLKQSQWKHWLLPISSVPDTEEKVVVRARLMEYMTLMIVEVFCHFFREYDENAGVLPKLDSGELVTLDFERRGKDATMTDFLVDAISYISLLHSRDVTTRILTAFITKLSAWNASFKPRWAAPTVSEKAWPNFFSMLAGIEEYLFFSNRKEKSALRKEREFSLGTGPVFLELPLVNATYKLLQKLKFDRWADLPENDAELGKLQALFQGKGQQEEAFFVGLRDFFALAAAGDQAVSQASPAFVALLLGRKAPYGARAQVERQVALFLGAPPPASPRP